MTDLPFMAPPDIVLDLPVPPSVNRTRRVDWTGNKIASAWKREADGLYMLAYGGRNSYRLPSGPLSKFELVITLSEAHTGVDLDNAAKCAIDYLKRVELIEDDGPKHLRKLTIEWGDAPEGCRVIARPVE